MSSLERKKKRDLLLLFILLLSGKLPLSTGILDVLLTLEAMIPASDTLFHTSCASSVEGCDGPL